MWVRTCQECFHKQEDKTPTYGEEPSETYCMRKCKKCKSESLDYGSERKELEETEDD